MTKLNSKLPVAVVVALLSANPALASEHGINRAANGVADAVTSPGKVVEGMTQDAKAYGPVGVVTGGVKGGVRAAGQLVVGAANFGIGVVETLAQPFASVE